MVVTDREQFCLLIGVNMAIMEIMYSLGARGGNVPRKEFMHERVTEILSEVCVEQGLKVGMDDFRELVPECFKAINLSNDMTDRLLRK